MIIAFMGQAGAGKTTCARMVKTIAPQKYKVERFSFAASLKQAASLIFGPTLSNRPDADYRGIYAQPPAFFGTQAAKEFPRTELGEATGRELLQKLGTFCREFNEDVFLRHLERSAPGTIQVIDDLRYPNEAARVHALGGIVVGLRVEGEPMAVGGHPSEAEMVRYWEEMVHETWTTSRGDLRSLRGRVLDILDRRLP